MDMEEITHTHILLVLLIIGGLITIFPIGVTESVAGESTGYFQTSDSDESEEVIVDDANATIEDFTPHAFRPGDDYHAFYSDAGVAEGTEQDIDDVNFSGTDYDEIGLQSRGQDFTYETSAGTLLPVNGNSLTDYRRSQLLSVNNSPYYTYVINNPGLNLQNDGNIENAYVEIVGINGGTQSGFPEHATHTSNPYNYMVGEQGEVLVYFDFQTDRLFKQRPEEKSTTQPVVTHEGTGTGPWEQDVYNDSYRQTQQRSTRHVEDFNTEMEVNVTGTAPDGSTEQYELGTITSSAREAEIENEDYTLVDSAETRDGYGGLSFAYNDSLNRELEFTAEGKVSTTASDYTWERERDRIYTDETSRVEASTRVEDVEATGTASDSCTPVGPHDHGSDDGGGGGDGGDGGSGIGSSPYGLSTDDVDKGAPDFDSGNATVGRFHSERDCDGTVTASTDCSTNVERDVTQEYTRTFYDLESPYGDYTNDGTTYGRETTVTRTKTVTISGEIEGTCSGEIPKGGQGQVSSDISGEISGSQVKTFKYDYWDWWHPPEEPSEDGRDVGGYDVQNRTIIGNNSVTVQDTVNAINTGTVEPPNVTQAVLRIDGDTYHSVLKIEDEDRLSSAGGVQRVDVNDAYLWSMVTYGPSTVVANDWRSYSETKNAWANSDLAETFDNARRGTQEPNPGVSFGTGPSTGPTTPGSGVSTSSNMVANQVYSFHISNDNSSDPAVGTRVEDQFALAFPAQLRVNTVPTSSGLELYTDSSTTRTRSPELAGWSGEEYGAVAGPNGSKGTYQIGSGVSVPLSDKPVFYDTIVMEHAPSPAQELITVNGDTYEIPESSTESVNYVEPDVAINYNESDGTGSITVTGVEDEPLEGRSATVFGAGGSQEIVTDANGTAEFNITRDLSVVQAEVEGDSLNDLLNEIDNSSSINSSVFYGSVTAQKGIVPAWQTTVGASGVDLIYRMLWASPIIMFYLFWRDTSLGT